MATSFSDNMTGPALRVPAWASALGVVAVVLGVFLTAYHGNEWMKHSVMVSAMPASGQMPAADCPEEELEEEGLSLAECEYLVERVGGIVLSMPDWFPGTFITLSVIGTLLAFLSIIVGGAMVNYQSWAPAAALFVFGGLGLVDVLQFLTVVNTGPVIREMYLWNILLWLLIHLLMITGVVAGRDSETAT